MSKLLFAAIVLAALAITGHAAGAPSLTYTVTSGTPEGGASAEATCMRVATATYTVGTARATGRDTPGAGAGPASAGLLPSTNSGIRPESWAGSGSAASIGGSPPTDSGAGSTAAPSPEAAHTGSAVVFTVAAGAFIVAVAFTVTRISAITLKVKTITMLVNVTSIPKTVLPNRVTIYSNANSNTITTLYIIINNYP